MIRVEFSNWTFGLEADIERVPKVKFTPLGSRFRRNGPQDRTGNLATGGSLIMDLQHQQRIAEPICPIHLTPRPLLANAAISCCDGEAERGWTR
ncbi:hypothetical protein CHELA40_13540 [Chelatococcus asaccharovorans]|nr:hypothetical protein CHELA40_13540 [Chelatococcus asaccharovorans]CAH1677317.1 hypothetical protein CHELA17_62081 [Chelatococcus asaccharovorans]